MRRADILEAAAEIFREKGYHAASMQDIADAVHLQKASVYHHVESKQDILLALLDIALDLLIADLQTVVDSDASPEDKLRHATRAYLARLTQEPNLAAVLLLEHRNLNPELRARHVQRRDRFERQWLLILEQGVDAGDFRPVDLKAAAFALLGAQNWMITWYQDGGRLSPEEIADQFSELFLRGLRAEG